MVYKGRNKIRRTYRKPEEYIARKKGRNCQKKEIFSKFVEKRDFVFALLTIVAQLEVRTRIIRFPRYNLRGVARKQVMHAYVE